MVNWPGFVANTHSVLVERLGFDTVFHSVAGTFNYDSALPPVSALTIASVSSLNQSLFGAKPLCFPAAGAQNLRRSALHLS